MLHKLPSFAKVGPQDLNKIIEAVNRGTDIVAAAPLEVTRYAGRHQLRLTESGWMGAVTGRTDLSSSSSSSASGGYSNRYKYTVQAVEKIPNGGWQYVPDGKVVAAWEWNDNKVAVNSVVWVEAFGDDWRFEHCCALPDGSSSSSSSSSRSSSSVSSQSQSSSSGSSSSRSSDSTSSTSSTSSSSGSPSSGSLSSSSSSSSSVSSSSVSSSSTSSSSTSSDSGSSSSQSTSSTSTSSTSQSSDSQSSDSCNGTLLEFISGLSFDAGSCTLTITKTRVCLPSCITVVDTVGTTQDASSRSTFGGGD